MVKAAELIPVPSSFLTFPVLSCSSLLLPWATSIAEPAVTDTYPSLRYSSRFFSICLRGLWPPSWETSCFLSFASSEKSGKLLSAHFFTITGSVSFFCSSSGLWLKILIQSECNQSTGLPLLATVMELPCHIGRPHVFLFHFHHLWNKNHCIPPTQPDPLLPRAWIGTTQIISVKLSGYSEDTMNVFGWKNEQPKIYM